MLAYMSVKRSEAEEMLQRVYDGVFLGKPTIIKQRFSKKYRHPVLDSKLTQLRFKQVHILGANICMNPKFKPNRTAQ